MKKQVQNFNKSDLAIHLSRKFPSLNDEIIIEGIDLVLQEIINTVALDNRVEIRGFGSFSKKTIRPRRFINPKLLNAPASNFFSEETSEYNKNIISQFPNHEETMNKWISIASKFQKEFEEMVKSKKKHRLNLDQYIDSSIAIKSDNLITDQLKKLNDLYKSGALTKEEFEKAKKKVLK